MATEAAHDAAAGAAGHAAAPATGMPQLDFSTWGNQIFWLVIALAAIYFVLSRVALPRIGAVLAERSGTITNDLAAAEELKQKAVLAEKAYNEALAKARAEAQAIVAETRAQINAQLAEATAKADAEISAKAAESEARIAEIRAGALQSVSEVARDTAEALVAALGGRADGASVQAAVAARMKG
ncbi:MULTISPECIES: F0F1 ATP synthase subunit B' [Rhodobacterales]|uniref:F0F1 ATP synthase subunit B' n=1 Tax=Rhodobacterales TaxID=204455 RepID=UPI000BBE5885|nr:MULTISPECIES: F0F1 ATP synthase subunit B' [Paracoccaceae]MCE6950013.1 F0F1 ATP synthase subunit B' [Cereibacter sphaeroides]MCE6967750.1 F0F1 ATP synthase subunit B' [Cereibacter sphaeroides]